MKINQSFILALLAFGSYAQTTSTQATTTSAETTTAASGTTTAADFTAAASSVVTSADQPPVCDAVDQETCPEWEKVCTGVEGAEFCQWCKKKADFEPDGPKCQDTQPWQYIFGQGAYSWQGFNIYDSTAENKKVVGRLDGQTGWTGVNQFGEKTMSYQIAIIIKAYNKLSDIFQNTQLNQEFADQFGFWVPLRGEGNPPEKWQMNLVDVFLREQVTSTRLQMRQSLYYKGLDLNDVTDYKGQFDDTYNISDWLFDRATGVLNSANDTFDSLKPKNDYWIPVQWATTISNDRLVISVEGTSLKQYLPEVRGGSKVPFYFQFIDFDDFDTSLRRRQLDKVDLIFQDDPNACNLPATCELPVEEEEGAFSLTTTLAASLFTVTALLSF